MKKLLFMSVFAFLGCQPSQPQPQPNINIQMDRRPAPPKYVPVPVVPVVPVQPQPPCRPNCPPSGGVHINGGIGIDINKKVN